MRITGGQARGRVISGPEGRQARPTASKVRQAFFNIVCNNVEGARFLDVCAGSGLMGLEALSRGAKSLVAIEEDRQLAKAIESNIKKLGFAGEVICGDARRVLALLPPQKFDLIFADPPYKSRLAAEILPLIEAHDLLAADGIAALEHIEAAGLPEETDELVKWKSKSYGKTLLSFFTFKDTHP